MAQRKSPQDIKSLKKNSVIPNELKKSYIKNNTHGGLQSEINKSYLVGNKLIKEINMKSRKVRDETRRIGISFLIES